MEFKHKKYISFILSFILLFLALPLNVIAYDDVDTVKTTAEQYSPEARYYIDVLGITYKITKSDKTYYLNEKYLLDKMGVGKRLVVYGDSVKADSDYKNKAGEYISKDTPGAIPRYFGFDINGNEFTNWNFPNDKTGEETVKKNWQTLSYLKKISQYNDNVSQAAEWLSNLYDPYAGDPSTDWLTSYNKLTGKSWTTYDLVDYALILQPPSEYSPGVVRMWHDVNGNLWYKTFIIPPKNLPPPKLPDLTVTDITYPLDAYVGDKITVTAKIKNIGDEDSTAFKVTLFDLGLVQDVGYLAKGATTDVSFTFTYNSAGEKNFTIKADSTSLIAEANEYNNTKDFKMYFYIKNQPTDPIAIISHLQGDTTTIDEITIKPNTNPQLDGSLSYSPGGEVITAYIWEYTDPSGTVNRGKPYLLSTEGDYTIKLKVINDAGRESEWETLLIHVQNEIIPPPDKWSDLTISAEFIPNEIIIGEESTLSGDTNASAYYWEFSDNLKPYITTDNKHKNYNLLGPFLNAGQYSATFYAKDGVDSGSDTAMLTVIDPTPVAAINGVNKAIQNRPLIIPYNLNDSYSPIANRGVIIDHKYDEYRFKYSTDSSYTTGMLTIAPNKIGTIYVEGRVKDSDGRQSDWDRMELEVIPDLPPTVKVITTDKTYRGIEEVVYIEANSPDYDIINKLTLYKIHDSDNDGDYTDENLTLIHTGDFRSSLKITHDKVGNYKYLAYIYEEYGLSSTGEAILTVLNQQPTVNFNTWGDTQNPSQDQDSDIPTRTIKATDIYNKWKLYNNNTKAITTNEKWALNANKLNTKNLKSVYSITSRDNFGLGFNRITPYGGIKNTSNIVTTALNPKHPDANFTITNVNLLDVHSDGSLFVSLDGSYKAYNATTKKYEYFNIYNNYGKIKRDGTFLWDFLSLGFIVKPYYVDGHYEKSCYENFRGTTICSNVWVEGYIEPPVYFQYAEIIGINEINNIIYFKVSYNAADNVNMSVITYYIYALDITTGQKKYSTQYTKSFRKVTWKDGNSSYLSDITGFDQLSLTGDYYHPYWLYYEDNRFYQQYLTIYKPDLTVISNLSYWDKYLPEWHDPYLGTRYISYNLYEKYLPIKMNYPSYRRSFYIPYLPYSAVSATDEEHVYFANNEKYKIYFDSNTDYNFYIEKYNANDQKIYKTNNFATTGLHFIDNSGNFYHMLSTEIRKYNNNGLLSGVWYSTETIKFMGTDDNNIGYFTAGSKIIALDLNTLSTLWTYDSGARGDLVFDKKENGILFYQSGKLVHIKSSEPSFISINDPNWSETWFDSSYNYLTNYQLDTTIGINDEKNGTIGYAFRIKDINNMYTFEWNKTDAKIYKLVNGIKIQLATVPLTRMATKTYQLKINVNGSNIEVYIDNIKRLTSTDTTFANGAFGPLATGQANASFGDIILTRLQDMDTAKTYNTVLVGETLNYERIFNDPENDSKYAEQWSIIHDPTFFNNPDPTSIYHNKTYATPPSTLDKAGRYEFTYKAQDNPILAFFRLWSEPITKEIFAHRRPIAKPNVIFTGMVYPEGEALDYETYDQSYDLDLPMLQAKIFRTRWSDETAWTYGKREYYNRPGVELIIQEQIQDIHGAWSYWGETRVYKATLPPVNQHKPTMTITYPNGTAANPTLVTNDPLIKWNYYDQDGDSQERYKLSFYYNDTNELALHFEQWNANKQHQLAEGLLAEDRIIRVEGQVYSKGTWSNLSNSVYFKIVRNRPPVASFTYIPSVPYEGDTINLTNLSTDPDNNITSYLWNVKRPDGSTYTETLKNIVIANARPGVYQVKLKVTDAYGLTNETNWLSITIFPLTINGQINHTERWNENRIQYNLAKTGTTDNPRTYDVFFPGEKFILNATTTLIAEESQITADKVLAGILDTSYLTELNKTGANIWEGNLWHEDMLKWDTRTITFRFVIYYSNGTIKYEDLPIRIDKDDYWRQHRKY